MSLDLLCNSPLPDIHAADNLHLSSSNDVLKTLTHSTLNTAGYSWIEAPIFSLQKTFAHTIYPKRASQRFAPLIRVLSLLASLNLLLVFTPIIPFGSSGDSVIPLLNLRSSMEHMFRLFSRLVCDLPLSYSATVVAGR